MASCLANHYYQKNVIPVKTGIQVLFMVSCLRMNRVWTPAFAGVTAEWYFSAATEIFYAIWTLSFDICGFQRCFLFRLKKFISMKRLKKIRSQKPFLKPYPIFP